MLTASLPDRGAAHQAAAVTRHGRIAQLVEQLTLNQRVLGSSPSASTKIYQQTQPLSGAAREVKRFGV